MVKSTIYFKDSEKVNTELFNQRQTLITVLTDFETLFERKPSPKELTAAFKAEYFEKNPFFNPGKVKTFPEVIDEYIKTMNAEGKSKSAEKYNQIKDNLIEFCKIYKKPLAFEAINMDFRADLLDYSTSVKEFRQTTIHRKMKFIKTIILYGLNNAYIKMDKLNINLTKWGVADGEAENIALSPEELKEIENLDLSDCHTWTEPEIGSLLGVIPVLGSVILSGLINIISNRWMEKTIYLFGRRRRDKS